jgi:3-oxoacyl-[acyl-carrier protein] reductase
MVRRIGVSVDACTNEQSREGLLDIEKNRRKFMSKLENKVAVVTGASKGIGAGIAKAFAAEGATVVVNYSSGKEDAKKLVGDIVAAGGKAVAIGANVAKQSEIASLFNETKRLYGRVDILVNNAGVVGFAPLEDITAEEFHRIYDVNVLGSLLATKAALPLFPETGGSVINISSAVSSLAPPMMSVYSSTKGALDVITKTLAKELAARKIRVNAINPGFIITEGAKTAGLVGSAAEDQFVAMTPLGRAGLPEDIALPAVFLASEDAKYITGETLYVSGGAGV